MLAFAREVDVVTFDHEHVPQDVLRALVDAGIPCTPDPTRCATRRTSCSCANGSPSSASRARVGARHHARRPRRLHRRPRRRGRREDPARRVRRQGRARRAPPAEVAEWFATIAEDGRGGALLVEEVVDFRRELAQLVARRPSGEVAAWPLVETVQVGGVCSEVIAPAPHSAGRVADVAADVAIAIADGLGVTGVLAVELFETTDDRVLVNELAMRPHNSGHWSMDGSTTSQFEQHLRAVLDLPLGGTGSHDAWSVMVNMLGGPAEGTLTDRYAEALAGHPTVKVHNYGKAPRPGRKVGHVTAIGPDLDDVVYEAPGAAAALPGLSGRPTGPAERPPGIFQPPP